MSLKELAPTYFTRLNKVIKEVGSPNRLLDAGCGDGVYDFYLKSMANEIASFDLNTGDIGIAKRLNPEENLLYCAGVIESVPFKSNAFDCLICVEILEHLEDDEAAIRELCRVLSEGGKLIVTVPSKNFPIIYDPVNFFLNKFGKKMKIGAWGWGHERLYTVEALKKKVGLRLVKAEYLSGAIVGLTENSYLNSFLQRFTKNDPLNREGVSRQFDRVARSVNYRAPSFLLAIRDLIILLDDLFFSKSRKSVGIMAVFEK